MKFYIFTYKCANKYNFNRLVCILPKTIAHDLGTARACNNREHYKIVMEVHPILSMWSKEKLGNCALLDLR